MKKLFWLYTFILISSCGLVDNFDQEPMYLELSAAELGRTYPSVNTHNITDAWVYVDGFNVGIFELPARVPILSEGEQVSVDIRAGVRDNGIVFSAKEYPYFITESYTLDFEPNATRDIELAFSYDEAFKVQFLEDFETTNIFFDDLDGDPTSTISRHNDSPYGNFCGKIDITPEAAFMRQATSTIFDTDEFSSSQVYLEIDYKCDVNFILGYVGHRNSVSRPVGVITLFASEEWNKLYLDLSSELNGGQYDGYQLMVAGPGTEQTGTVLIDNIRIVHF